MHSFALVFSVSVLSTFVAAQTSGPLRACTTFFTSNGVRLGVYSASKVGTNNQVFQCNYASQDASVNATCSYDSTTFALIPTGTPSGIDSDPSCSNPLPHGADAGAYLIRPSRDPGFDCIGAGSETTTPANGLHVFLGDCNGRHNYPLQSWIFDGLRIRQTDGNLCLDVTDGTDVNGAKLQLWECVEGNTNQMWSQLDSDFLLLPSNRIQWKGHSKCVDLTNGDVVNNLQTQIWDCIQGNTNQEWTLQPAN